METGRNETLFLGFRFVSKFLLCAISGTLTACFAIGILQFLFIHFIDGVSTYFTFVLPYFNIGVCNLWTCC